jgi:hypothetical protein
MTDVVRCATTSGPAAGREIDDDRVLSGSMAFAAGARAITRGSS